MKIQFGVLLLAAAIILSGCTLSEEPSDGATASPQTSETQTSEAVEGETLVTSEDAMAAFLTPSDVSPLAVNFPPKAEAFEGSFFGDLLESEACSESNLESLVSALDPLASQVIRLEQEMPAYIIQWAFIATSVEEADSVVQQFDENYLSPECHESIGYSYTEKVDLDGALPEGSRGFFWVDNQNLLGDVYSQIRGVSSVGQIVYFSYTVTNDDPESAILPDDLSRITGAGMNRFLEDF